MGATTTKQPSPFGARILELRTERGWTQAELGTRAGLHTLTISHYETGQRVPKLDNLQKLARAFGVTVDALLPTPTE